MRGHLGDLAVLDGHVHQPIDVVLVVEHMPAAQQQIVGGRCLLCKGACAGKRQQDQ